MKSIIFLLTLITKAIILLLIQSQCSNLTAQNRMSGFVRDSITREVLVGAYLFDSLSNKAVTTDNNGFFNIPIQKEGAIIISYVGYKKKVLHSRIFGDTLLQVLLSTANELDEVVIVHPKKQAQNVSTLSRQELQALPAIGSKPDVMKAIQLLPGIQSQNEGSSLIMVRGGNPGENLYLLDNVALIYVNHLGGFMSVFNPDMINSIDVYKGSFPSRYGGKLSSIMDITQREGNPNKIKGAVSIGITDISFLAEGPTGIKNTTFLLTGRKTLMDPLMALASKITDGGNYVISYGFHDLNGKLTWQPNNRDNISINLYQGDDYLNYWYKSELPTAREKARMTNIWGNWLLSAKWSHILSSKLVSTQNLSYVNYRLRDKQTYTYKGIDKDFEFNRKYSSSVGDLSYKYGWKYFIQSNWIMDFGLQTSYLQHRPNSFSQSNQVLMERESPIPSLETSLYVENKWIIVNAIQLKAGTRAINYITQNFKNHFFEPRLCLELSVSKNHSLNSSYMIVNQFSHLLFTNGSIMSNEVWVPADGNIIPARSEQLTVGWSGRFINNMFDTELNIYHKTLSNLSTYREGYTNLIGDGNWRSKIETGGCGEAYGLETMIRKNYGSWTGFLTYSWSKSTRKFDKVNNGKTYLFEFDRPHSLSLSFNKKISERLSLNLIWIFQTGLPFTPVIGRHLVPSLEFDVNNVPFYYEVLIYGDRNSERMKDYHRLDLAIHYTTHTKRGGYKAQWSFAIYNLYNRRNPYYYYYNDTDKGEIYKPSPFENYRPLSLYQVSFFPIIPTISYKVVFDEQRGVEKERKERKNLLRKFLNH